MSEEIKIKLVRELREITGCGMIDAKKALEKANYDLNKAIEYISLAAFGVVVPIPPDIKGRIHAE